MENTPTNKLTLLGLGTMLVSGGGMAVVDALQASPMILPDVVTAIVVTAVGGVILWAREQIKIPKDGEE